MNAVARQASIYFYYRTMLVIIERESSQQPHDFNEGVYRVMFFACTHALSGK